MSDAGEFGRLLRRLRRERDLTQEALAQAAFCARDTVKKIEAGQRRPSRQMATQFADVLALEGAERTQFLAAARVALAPDRLVPPDDVQTPAIVAVPVIPAPTAALIGRAQELAAVRALFTQPAIRLLTLTGPGGIGKTRLALQLAHEVGLSFPDGCTFVDLSPLLLPEHVLPAVAQALMIRELGRESLEQRVQAYLALRRYLLVLDNFEHVLAAATLVAGLLRAAPALRVMVASRVALRLSGEQEYPVPPLAVPPGGWEDAERRGHGDGERESAFSKIPRLPPEEIAHFPAVQLFVERARAVRPDFTLTEANAPLAGCGSGHRCAPSYHMPLPQDLARSKSLYSSPVYILFE